MIGHRFVMNEKPVTGLHDRLRGTSGIGVLLAADPAENIHLVCKLPLQLRLGVDDLQPELLLGERLVQPAVVHRMATDDVLPVQIPYLLPIHEGRSFTGFSGDVDSVPGADSITILGITGEASIANPRDGNEEPAGESVLIEQRSGDLVVRQHPSSNEISNPGFLEQRLPARAIPLREIAGALASVVDE